MKSSLTSLLVPVAAFVLAVLPLRATEYLFGNFDTTLFTAAGPAWPGALDLQLGGFSGGFTPTNANTGDWLANWISDPSGYYTPVDGPEWSASLALIDNVLFTEGASLYLWVFDTQTGPASEWGLFTDATWLVAANSSIDPSVYSYDFGGGTTAVFGQVNHAGGVATTAAVSAVPEPGSTAAILGLVVLTGGLFRRRVAGLARARS
jgi:hypothetical protein